MSEDQTRNLDHLIHSLQQILGQSTSFGDSMMATSPSFPMFQGYVHPSFMQTPQSTPQLNHPPEHAQNFPSQFIFYPSILNPYMNPHNDPSYTYQNVLPSHYVPNISSRTTYQFRNTLPNNSQNSMQGTTQNTVPPSPPDIPPLIPPRPNRPPLPQPPAPPPLPPNIPQPPTPTPAPPPPYSYVQPNAPFHLYQNIQPQIQYVYLPPPHINTLENNIPQTSHIPELKTRADWAAWYHSVQNLLTSRALFTHICDPPASHIAHDPMNTTSFPPVLHPYPQPQHI
ncbi:hypothetical protein ARMSODRAFT_1016185 [Armillaria solidipes]|uniref:Uncharacterized protein n=1 Tax=Armillaria solidipes TaxID=1076256 RepID=A0A2H3BMT4_9AGAR|nr:hypothetical protein ARMSODRAFT_1016185 [Armillaria solidipes]